VRNFILLLILLSLNSCGFKTSDVQEVISKAELLKDNDFDGDLVSDEQESKQGTSPYLADLPNLKVRFLQNYKIEVAYKNEDPKRSDKAKLLNFTIDTKVGRDDPDFKYRVGRIFIRDKAYNDSAKVGQFADHSWGEIKQHDLSWIKYPKIDPTFFAKSVLDYKNIFNLVNIKIDNIKVSLENSVKLKSNSLYKEIKNLEFNFYYFDYEKESYQLIATKKVEKTFKAGVNETFTVDLENLPKNIIEHNYMKKGEFIISEIKDFEIPKLKTTYKRLLTSIKSKSIPIIFNTPLEQNTYYVGLGGSTESFISILTKLFDKKFTVKNNKLVKINQFKSNLPEYTYLSEVKKEDKKGKWFVFTNKLNKHYLDYSFKPSDVISLSYVLGSELSQQNEEKIFNFKNEISSTPDSAIYPLGNITPNSKVNIQLRPSRIFGDGIKNDHIHFIPKYPPCKGNCVRWKYECQIDVNTFYKIDLGLLFQKDLSKKFSKISLLINDEEFNLKKLIEEKKVSIKWKDQNIHLIIKDINQIKPLDTFNENLLALKLKGISKKTYNGFKLASWHGDAYWLCPQVMRDLAGGYKIPISTQSFKLNEWQHQVNWKVIERGADKTWKQEFSIGLFSLIENNYN